MVAEDIPYLHRICIAYRRRWGGVYEVIRGCGRWGVGEFARGQGEVWLVREEDVHLGGMFWRGRRCCRTEQVYDCVDELNREQVDGVRKFCWHLWDEL
jgi:hypothetical protein